MMGWSFSQLVLAIGLGMFLVKRVLRYLRYFQQEEYSPRRFIAWIIMCRAWDRSGTTIALFGLAGLICSSCVPVIMLVMGLFYAVLGYRESDPRFEGKKKLVLTQRARAIWLIASVLAALFAIEVSLTPTSAQVVLLIVLSQLPPFLLIAAVILLIPREKAIQKRLKQEAHRKFVSIDPFSIGVTGSFGKTSVKNLLGEIMSQSLGPTFWPKAGVNTEMGITREIREKMNQYDRYAIIEMGAYHRGSIARLCRLTPVKAGIVTAVHLMHLERFGSEADIYQAKSELPQNVPAEGILVVNGDNPGARKMATDFPKSRTFIYGLETERGHLDTLLSNIVTERDGTAFSLDWNGKQYQGRMKMHGKGALSNIAGCFTMACALGADPQVVLAIVRNITPVSNRLEVKDYGDYIQINDAYNSNPQGFRYALEVLRDLPGRRRILVTPGMIELGDQRDEENRKVAVEAARVCDTVVVVNQVNRAALLRGLEDGGLAPEKVKCFDTRDEALQFISADRKAGDVVLIENDLPDLLEFSEVF